MAGASERAVHLSWREANEANQDALAAEGWESSGLKDVTVRADIETTATLVRVNDAGDTITVGVSHRDGEDGAEVEVVVFRAES